jgi:Fe-S-cluster-containing hydrogenase component 2
MSIKINPVACPQNHKCPIIFYCPAGAISQDGYGLPKIDEEKCTNCGKCVKMCPTRAMYIEKQNVMIN